MDKTDDILTEKMKELIDAQKYLEAESRSLVGKRERIMREHGGETGDPVMFELRAYLDDKELYQKIAGVSDEIDNRLIQLEEVLPEGFGSLVQVAEHADAAVRPQEAELFDPIGRLREKYKEMVKAAIIDREVGECKRAVHAVKNTVFDLTDSEMKSAVGSRNADDMIHCVEDAFIERQRKIFSEAMGIADDNTVYKVVKSDGIIDVDRLQTAFRDAKEIESGELGSGQAWMEDELRDVFGDAFTDSDYERMAAYEDADELIGDLNKTCRRVGLYDSDIVRSGIESIDPAMLASVATADPSLKAVFGDAFSKNEYDLLVGKIITRQDIVERNRKNLSDQFDTLRVKSRIMFGRLIEGLSKEDYHAKWGDDDASAIEIQHAKGMFDRAIQEIDNDTMIDKGALLGWLEDNAGMKDRPYALNRLAVGIQTMCSIEQKNADAVEAKIKKMLGKRLKDDVFSEDAVERGVEKRRKMEKGDVDDAKAHATSEIRSVVRGTNVSRFAETLSDACRGGVEKSFDASDRLVEEFERKKERFIMDKHDDIRKMKVAAIDDLYATDEEVVSGSSYWSDLEKKFGKKQVDGWKESGASIDVIEEYERDKVAIIDKLEAIYGKQQVDPVRSRVMDGVLPEKHAINAIQKQLMEERWNEWQKTYGKKLVAGWKTRSKRMSKIEILEMVAEHDHNVNMIVDRLETDFGKKSVRFVAPRLKKGTISESDAIRILEEKR